MISMLLFMGLVIGSNNLAAALAIGTLGENKRWWRIFLVFGMFEFLMPLLGVWIGLQTSSFVGGAATILSVVILLGLAAVSFYAATKPAQEDKALAIKITSWKGLILLELGLSLDNLIAGFGLGIRGAELSPLLTALTIALFSVAYTWLGLHIGNKVASKWQNYAELGAGLLLCLLAGMTWFDVI